MAHFADQVRAWADKAAKRQDAAARAFVGAVGQELVMRSPVLTGRFRSNWRASVNGLDPTIDGTTDKTGEASIARIRELASTVQVGDVITLSNSLPYAQRLEYGWSRQAPFGMVRVTRVRADVILRDALRTI